MRAHYSPNVDKVCKRALTEACRKVMRQCEWSLTFFDNVLLLLWREAGLFHWNWMVRSPLLTWHSNYFHKFGKVEQCFKNSHSVLLKDFLILPFTLPLPYLFSTTVQWLVSAGTGSGPRPRGSVPRSAALRAPARGLSTLSESQQHTGGNGRRPRRKAKPVETFEGNVDEFKVVSTFGLSKRLIAVYIH